MKVYPMNCFDDGTNVSTNPHAAFELLLVSVSSPANFLFEKKQLERLFLGNENGHFLTHVGNILKF